MNLTAEHICYTYPKEKAPVLRDISFEAAEGDVTVIIGANGTGKTTLLKCLLGYLKGGGITRIGGRDRREYSYRRLSDTVGYMTQEGALMSGLSVLDVVLLGRLGTLNLRVQDEDVEKAASILRMLHLESLAARPFYALSGGQRRMVDAAQTLVRDPSVLIMDEPTANLDLIHELQVLELVKEYTHQKKTATLLTLHDLNMASRFADRLVLLKDGTVYRMGTPAEVITEEHIREAYGVQVRVTEGSEGRPVMQVIAPAVTAGDHF